MLMASVIILFVASGILIAVSSFTKKRGLFYFIFSSLAIVSLAVTMILSANYNNNFFGFSIISMSKSRPRTRAAFFARAARRFTPRDIL